MNSEKKISYLNQYVVAFSGTLLMLSVAASFGWTSPTLPKLLGPDSPIPITNGESSWIVALMTIGTIFGPIPTFFLVDRIGRKYTLLLTSIPLILAWILIIVANSAGVLYVSRILSGISYGMAYSATPMFLGEIASDSIRGSIGTLITVMAKLGILIAYAVGPYVSVKALASILLVTPIIFICVFMWLPESPYYLMGKKKEEEATKSLEWLRGHKDVKEELLKIDAAVIKANANKGTLKELFTKGNRMALIIVLGLGAAQQLCGSQAVVAYSTQLFEEVGSGLDAKIAAIIMGVVQLITAGFSSYIVDSLGRRPLLLLSTTGAAICNIIVGVYFFLKDKQGIDTTGISWLPILAIMIFIVSYTIGLATVPFAILGEVFPTNIKALASGAYTVFASLIAFGVSKLYQIVNDHESLGTHVTFFSFGVFSFLFIFFVWFLVPETKGKSLDAILEELNSTKNKKEKYFKDEDKVTNVI